MEVFFYGLFMDVTLLLQKGINPSYPTKGFLNDYTLKIGKRASLVPSRGERAYGIVMTIDDLEIHKLYAETSVADYFPQNVKIITFDNHTIPARCYNLPIELLSGTNESYAISLYKLAKRQGFPDDYLEKIRKMASTSVN